MKTHPLADALPMATGNDFLELVESIRKNGQIEPIVAHDGMIVDGRNRLKACKKLNITPKTVEMMRTVRTRRQFSSRPSP